MTDGRDMCAHVEESGDLCRLSRKNPVHTPGLAGPYHPFLEALAAQIVPFKNRMIKHGRVVDERDVVVRLRERAKVYMCGCNVHVQWGEVCIKCALVDAADEIERLRTIDHEPPPVRLGA